MTSSLEGQRVLVTGGSGFIGRHLTRAVVDAGGLVTTLSRSGGACAGGAHVQADVRGEAAAQRAAEADLILHLAGSGDVDWSRRDPRLFHEVIVAGTLNVLASVRRGATFVLPSTQRVYRPSGSPLRETAAIRPADPYALSKLQAELLCRYFAREAGVRTRVVRLFSVYGPGQSGQGTSGVVAIFLARALSGQPLQVLSAARRDFTYVGDVVRGVMRLLDGTGPMHRVYNLATGIGTTLAELARAVVCATETAVPIVVSGSEQRVADLVADISRAREELRYAPAYSLAEGLRLTLGRDRGQALQA